MATVQYSIVHYSTMEALVWVTRKKWARKSRQNACVKVFCGRTFYAWQRYRNVFPPRAPTSITPPGSPTGCTARTSGPSESPENAANPRDFFAYGEAKYVAGSNLDVAAKRCSARGSAYLHATEQYGDTYPNSSYVGPMGCRRDRSAPCSRLHQFVYAWDRRDRSPFHDLDVSGLVDFY